MLQYTTLCQEKGNRSSSYPILDVAAYYREAMLTVASWPLGSPDSADCAPSSMLCCARACTDG